MDLSRKPQVAALVLRILLGLWFAYTGGLKIFGTGLDRFIRDVGNYKLVGPPWDAVAAYSVPWVELVAGFCLMLGIFRRGAILAIGGLVVVFSIAVGWAWSQGLDISCGCLASDAPMNYWRKVFEFLGYFTALGWLWWMEGRNVRNPA